MPSYAYRAVQSSGRIERGRMTAGNENELAYNLNERGMELIEAKEEQKSTVKLSFSRTVPINAVAAFCERMNDLLKSGLNFPQSFPHVIDTTENKSLLHALTQISRSITNGAGIAASFALYPKIFPPVFTAIIGAGEQSGDMTGVFGFLSGYAESQARTQENLRRALRYPLFLFFVAGGATVFMMTMVIPQVVEFLNGIEGKLPLSTRILVRISGMFENHGLMFIGVMAAMLLILYLSRKIYFPVALFLDRVFLKTPLVGTIVLKSSLARFARSFCILFRSGCDVPACLLQAQDVVDNRFLRMELSNAGLRVHSGASLSSALEGMMPPFSISMLRIGERSGDIGKSLDDIAVIYDREAKAATDKLIGMLEPGLTLIIGAILAWTVVAMLGPLYGGLSVLGGRM